MPYYKLMGMVTAIFICLCAPITAQTSAKPRRHAKTQKSPTESPAPPASKQVEAPPLQSNIQPEQPKNENKLFKLTTADKTIWDWIAYAASLALAVFGTWGVIVANRT